MSERVVAEFVSDQVLLGEVELVNEGPSNQSVLGVQLVAVGDMPSPCCSEINRVLAHLIFSKHMIPLLANSNKSYSSNTRQNWEYQKPNRYWEDTKAPEE